MEQRCKQNQIWHRAWDIQSHTHTHMTLNFFGLHTTLHKCFEFRPTNYVRLRFRARVTSRIRFWARVRWRGLGSATPKVRHSEGPPFRRSGPPKAVTNPNPNPIWSAIVISWTCVCVSVCYSCTLTKRLVQDLRSGGPSKWRTVTVEGC